MYIRTAAVILIILGGAFCGLNCSEKLRSRAELCRETEKMLRMCEFSIKSCEADVYSIASKLRAAGFRMLSFLSELPESYEECSDFHGKWRASVLKCHTLSYDERELLIEIGAALGSCDTEGQLKELAAYRERVQELYEQRLAEYRSKGRLYRSLGLLAGVTLGIIVI